MAEVKALFPIGKTQWRKWRPEQQIAFNEARASGVPFPDAVKYVNELELVEVNIAPRNGLLDVLEGVVEAVTQVETVVAVAKPLVKAVRGKRKVK